MPAINVVIPGGPLVSLWIPESKLPEDTCVAYIKTNYGEEDGGDHYRFCMKERRHQRHDGECEATQNGGGLCMEHHTFVPGAKPKMKVRCLSDLWE